MPDTPNQDFLKRLVHAVDPDAALLRAWPLAGGVSAQVTALEVTYRDGQTRRMVVRQHGAADLAGNPNLAADEFRLLELLRAAGIPVPQPYYANPAGEILGTSCVVVEYVAGESVFAPADESEFVGQLAAHLAAIHQSCIDAPFLPSQLEMAEAKVRNRPEMLDQSLDEGRLRDALAAAWPPDHINPTALLHGDFWPGNLLWREGRVVSIIDWEDAKRGDPLADLANARLELLWLLGDAAMHSFTQAYRERSPGLNYAGLPVWDLYAALKPMHRLALWAGGDAAAERRMHEGHRRFAAQALAALGDSRRGQSA